MRIDASHVFQTLLAALGPQHWWPANSPLEVMVGAVLVQNTAWANVERAIANLRDAEVLEPHRLVELSPEELEALIRPAGYFRVKAKRLANLMRWFVGEYDGSIDALRQADMTSLREELLAINGIGPETADSILLYALEMPALAVDAYTLRIWARHGWIDYDADYSRLQERLVDELPVDPATYNELHALIVEVGKRWCKPQPKCADCPLCGLLPPGGIAEPW
ncbi:MAG: endonuclease III domain-containing protein [Pirellulales bacterium]|nr:endonuclease III domain-containing protein [Pirellulales bacterium]